MYSTKLPPAADPGMTLAQTVNSHTTTHAICCDIIPFAIYHSDLDCTNGFQCLTNITVDHGLRGLPKCLVYVQLSMHHFSSGSFEPLDFNLLLAL